MFDTPIGPIFNLFEVFFEQKSTDIDVLVERFCSSVWNPPFISTIEFEEEVATRTAFWIVVVPVLVLNVVLPEKVLLSTRRVELALGAGVIQSVADPVEENTWPLDPASPFES